MRVQVPTVEGIAPPAGAPALSASRWSPVFIDIPEAGAVDHFLFGGSEASLVGLKGRSTLTAANPSSPPVYAPASLTLSAGGRNGLLSPMLEPDAYTLCCVVKYTVDALGRMLFGTSQGGSGDGKGFALLNDNLGSFSALMRPNGNRTPISRTLLVDLLGSWVFVAFGVDAQGNRFRTFVGGVNPVELVNATQYARSDRVISLGNAHYESSAGVNYKAAGEYAEFIQFQGYLDQPSLQAIYQRSKLRLAARGITVY